MSASDGSSLCQLWSVSATAFQQSLPSIAARSLTCFPLLVLQSLFQVMNSLYGGIDVSLIQYIVRNHGYFIICLDEMLITSDIYRVLFYEVVLCDPMRVGARSQAVARMVRS